MSKNRLGALVSCLLLAGCEFQTDVAPQPHASSPQAPMAPASRSASPSRNTREPISCFRDLDRPAPLTPITGQARGWRSDLDRLIGDADVSVALARGRRLLYEHRGAAPRTPASNQKLLLSMALLDEFPKRYRVRTVALSEAPAEHIVEGDVFILGAGDPTFGDAGYRDALGLNRSPLGAIARRIDSRGIRVIRGDVVGVRSLMRADWDAPGWQSFVQQTYVARPTALSFNGNKVQRPSPELQVAMEIKERLEILGVNVLGRPRMEVEERPRRAFMLAGFISPPLTEMLGIMNRESNNFFAEVLGKKLAVRCVGPPGTIAKAAQTIGQWARRLGVEVVAHDSSGLSYRNRVTARGMMLLLAHAGTRPWGASLRRVLPRPGEGTLADRLAGIRVRAKTGSLFDGSHALSGWVWLEREEEWAAFSILSPLGGAAAPLEDRIVRLLATRATW